MGTELNMVSFRVSGEFATLILICIVGSKLVAQSKPAADLIITNAKVWTVDKTHPTAQAVAVLGDRIVAVGSNADIDVWRGHDTKVIDAGGKLLLPGIQRCSRAFRQRWLATGIGATE